VNINVTGATGFVGRHLVAALLARGHGVTAIARDPARMEAMPWGRAVRFVAADVLSPAGAEVAAACRAEVLVHLAWEPLNDYRAMAHLERTLPASFAFIKNVVAAGTPRVLVTGTCLEYGMQEGCLTEDLPACPTTAYGTAKHCLRLCLDALRAHQPFSLHWARLFYLHGPGQAAGSLLQQLESAIARGDAAFAMSPGDQLRDFMPVEEAAQCLAALIERPQHAGITNICTGRPVSVRGMVERRLAERGASLRLELGRYAYPDYEPRAFWGSRLRLDRIMAAGA
jgi:nucleoside-diphosphate-sugar epimerase